eukprot:COSAG02_NODE_59836_length_273_cov_0.591954_1_plen_58_part_10
MIIDQRRQIVAWKSKPFRWTQNWVCIEKALRVELEEELERVEKAEEQAEAKERRWKTA